MQIKEIIEVVILVLLGGASLYFKYNAKLNTKVNSLIDEAEQKYKDVTTAGSEKNNYVVEKLYSLIPAPFRFIVSKDLISTIVNNTFNAMESYAIKQIDKVVNSQIEDSEDEDATDEVEFLEDGSITISADKITVDSIILPEEEAKG